MPARRITLLALVLITVVTTTAVADDFPEAFLEVNASDFTNWCFDGGSCLGPAGRIYYNRVDGIDFYLGLRYRSETRLHPRVVALWGWPSARSGSFYQLEFEQPLLSQKSLSFGVDFYKKTAMSRQDEEAIGDLDNNLRAVTARRDLRDYFMREGGTFFVQHIVNPEFLVRLEYRTDDLTSLTTAQSVWSLVRNNERWRENPALMVGNEINAWGYEGKMNSWYLNFAYDSRDAISHSGWRLRGFFERSGKGTGGDYDFVKYTLDVMPYWRITDTQTLTLMSQWGIASGTDFPSHKLFYLGGIENLAGYERKEYSGKNVFFTRLEYGVRIWHEFEVIYYADVGETWSSRGYQFDELKYDLGIGFHWDAPGLGEFRVDVARAFEDNRDLMVDFRLYVN